MLVLPMLLNSSQSSQSSEEKFILSDSQKDNFTVTIRDISTADDGGVYLCGVERDQSDKRPSETSITHISFIKEIHLNVYAQEGFKADPEKNPLYSTYSYPQTLEGLLYALSFSQKNEGF
ncbi:hypothetical protein QQF64_000326 [Cirrhinus molitorella]|uniref:Immunoglobulin V-set domain-containing protein n=1 Tax=Cirrhinus molitorella TaxID=172907 RepID=A0ABR3NWV4_9TELE